MHGSVKSSLNELRSRFWIVQGRQFVRKLLYQCVVCWRLKERLYQAPPPPPLPKFRIKLVFNVLVSGWTCTPLETSKLQMLEANCGVASVSRGRLSLKLIKMKLQRMCLDSAIARSFWAWIFRFSDRAFGNGGCSPGPFYVHSSKPRNG